ncbi:mitochondrial ribosomal protein L50 [Osmia lignaria lignaria]|uniref:mitochondrial ribosomal protein L50 n=1 Tax=Osmia lignaria lignaria TaxID=1437193 RepID=UPI00402B88CD
MASPSYAVHSLATLLAAARLSQPRKSHGEAAIIREHLGGFSLLNGDRKMADDGKQQAQPPEAPPTAQLAQFPSTTRKKMAALIRHGLLANPFKSSSTILVSNTTSFRYDVTRFKSCKKSKPVKKSASTFKDDTASLSTKGFLRYRKAYNPPDDVSNRINKICEEQSISASNETKINDPLQRFNLFLACEREFDHLLNNSNLCFIETIADLKEYYQTPVGNATPWEVMRKMDLPPNLHINYDYVRFHPDTDTIFNGKTAFPKSSTLVTGLKYKKKYPGHQQEDPYLEHMLKI